MAIGRVNQGFLANLHNNVRHKNRKNETQRMMDHNFILSHIVLDSNPMHSRSRSQEVKPRRNTRISTFHYLDFKHIHLLITERKLRYETSVLWNDFSGSEFQILMREHMSLKNSMQSPGGGPGVLFPIVCKGALSSYWSSPIHHRISLLSLFGWWSAQVAARAGPPLGGLR